MKTFTILRILITAEIFFGVLAIVADLTTQASLPVEFQRYLENDVEADLTISRGLGLGFGLLSFLGIIVGWVGMWRLWRPARMIYTVSWILGVPVYLMFDPVSWNTPVGALSGEYSVLAAGAIMSLLHFSNLAEHFNKKKAEQVGAGDAEEAV